MNGSHHDDGGPGRDDQGDDMNCGLTIDQHERLRSALRALPETMPPRSVWQRIDVQARAEGLIRPAAVSQRLRWAAGSGIAAAVVLAVLTLPGGGDQPVALTPTESATTVPEYRQSPAELRLRSINALMVQSQVLERDLRRLPASPRLMQVGTAATIEDLQNRIAAIDYRLDQPGQAMSREQQELYWRERVRLMDSLVRLRLAQTQRGSF